MGGLKEIDAMWEERLERLSAQLRHCQEARGKQYHLLSIEHRLLSLLLKITKGQEQQLQGHPAPPDLAALKKQALAVAEEHDSFIRGSQGTLESCLILTPEPETSSSPPSAPSDGKNRTEGP